MRKNVTLTALIFAAIYMVSYLTRINFGAIVSEMELATGISKNLLSLSLTGSFITYGIGQTLSGVAVDRISPPKIITAGLLITMTMNLIMPLCKGPYIMLCVWCINGFAQSMMWPPIVKMMTNLFDGDAYKKAAVIVSWGSSVGTMVVYLLAPLVLTALSWQWVFWICGLIALITVILWQFFRYTPELSEGTVSTQKGRASVFLSPLIIGIMLAIILQGMLRDGVTTWMPSYIVETYEWSTASSILTAVILPVFSIICFHLASGLYTNILKNPMLCAGVFFALGLLSSVGLYFATGRNAAISVLLSAILTGAMHGVNMMLISMIPPYFKRFGLTGAASGILNSCTYVGSALSTYGIAVLSETFGWKVTIVIWAVIAFAGTAVCLLCVKPFYKNFQ